MLVLEHKGGGWLLCESLHLKEPAGNGYRRETIHENELRVDNRVAA